MSLRSLWGTKSGEPLQVPLKEEGPSGASQSEEEAGEEGGAAVCDE